MVWRDQLTSELPCRTWTLQYIPWRCPNHTVFLCQVDSSQPAIEVCPRSMPCQWYFENITAWHLKQFSADYENQILCPSGRHWRSTVLSLRSLLVVVGESRRAKQCTDSISDDSFGYTIIKFQGYWCLARFLTDSCRCFPLWLLEVLMGFISQLPHYSWLLFLLDAIM